MAMTEDAFVGFSCVFLFIPYFIEFSPAEVVLDQLDISFPDLPANLAVENKSGICGALEVNDPIDACAPLRNKFGSHKTDQTRFALIISGNCSFEEKIRKAQSGGFSAAIIYNDEDVGKLVNMTVNPKGINVVAVFVSKSAGIFLKDHTNGEKGECCIDRKSNGKALTVFVASFTSLFAVAGFLVVVSVSLRIFSNRRSRRRNLVKAVDKKTVKALPRAVFSSARLREGHTGETCAICLEDYNDGEILKILPCQHDFHSSCVKSWLTKWGTFCPVCKLDMITKTAYSEVREQRP